MVHLSSNIIKRPSRKPHALPSARCAPNHGAVSRLPHGHRCHPKGLTAAGAKLGHRATDAWDGGDSFGKTMGFDGETKGNLGNGGGPKGIMGGSLFEIIREY